MRVIADLHIHSRFSRATSRELNLKNLEKYAKIKGVNLLSTGDFTHPRWVEELKQELLDDGSGVLRTKTGFPFVLQAEVSNIYSQDGKLRKIHNVLLARNFDVIEQVNELLGKKGKLESDGRPIFGSYSCYEMVEDLKKIDNDIEIIPAHIWTPWFSLFGSMSGFDRVEDCYKDQTKHIHALETGLSSDPAMNWRLSALDKFSLVSNSDLHSFWPWRIGREANIFEMKELSYDNIIKTLKTRENFKATIEVNPTYGKYHYDGHRFCKVCMEPKDSLKANDICPKCGRRLTLGVLHRVEQLADREEGFKLKGAVPFYSLIPLSEILANITDSGIATKKIWGFYNALIEKFGNEFNVLLEAEEDELKKVIDEKIAKAITNNREGKISVQPGYDGEYGFPVFDEKVDKPKQLNLSDF